MHKQLRKYLIMGSQNCTRDPIQILSEAISAGITAFQFREKGHNALVGDELLQLGKKLRELCLTHGILFIVNDDIKLAQSLQADGIHIGQSDLSVEEIRKVLPNKLIGLSVSNLDELNNSPITLVDYLGAGPIFTTSTKTDAKTAVGLQWMRELREKLPSMPIVGIGGINTANAASVIEAGANGVSVISAITKAEDIKTTVQNL